MTPRQIVMVGASLAGAGAARELRNRGYEGRLTMIGDEPHRPYNRPPLSKQLLTGQRTPEQWCQTPNSVNDHVVSCFRFGELGGRPTQ